MKKRPRFGQKAQCVTAHARLKGDIFVYAIITILSLASSFLLLCFIAVNDGRCIHIAFLL